jgi:SAM-dependent methyltransferase
MEQQYSRDDAISRDALANSLATFRNPHYQRHNRRRQEHLASLGLDLRGKTVLELGAGIGDHTTFFLDRDCKVVSVEPRAENCYLFAQTMSTLVQTGYKKGLNSKLIRASVESLDRILQGNFDIVYCYGLLYHVADPEAVLELLARYSSGLFLLETCVSFGGHEMVNPIAEPQTDPSQSFDGTGCRPSRRWIFDHLRELFAHVYVPRTQPAHEEFPLDWTAPVQTAGYTRAVFVGARASLENPLLLVDLPDHQTV